MNTVATPNLSPKWLAWLWLLMGAALLPWITTQTVIPIAAWLAPIFLLRFTRTQRAAIGLPLVVLVNIGAQFVASRNGIIPGPPGAELYIILASMGLIVSLSYIVDRLIAPRLTGLTRTLVFPCSVVAIDLLMDSVSPFGLFGTPAYSQFGNLPLLQLLSLTGVWGLTFLISWGAAAVNALWEENFDLRATRLSVGLFVSIMAAVLLFGGARLAFAMPDAPTVQVASLASTRLLSDAFASARADLGSATLAERAAVDEQYLQPMLDDLFARTEAAARGGAKIVAWAEAAAFVLKENEAQVIERGQHIARAEGIYLQMALIPILHSDHFPYVENRAVLIDPEGEVVWRYDKSKPVPGDGHLAGAGIIPTVDTPYGRLATIICFDADFPSLVRQVGQAGVDLLLVPASDWEAVSEMHSRTTTFRALENGVNLVRPTRQGTSLAIDYQGRFLGYNADYFIADRHTLVTSVPTQGVTTLYAQIGDSFAYLCVAGLAALMLLALAPKRQAQPTTMIGAPAKGF